MGRRKRKIDYRQLYKDYYNIEFGREMVVHHIDFDRSNNNINNLLLMPNWLHAKYHMTLSMLTGINGELSLTNELKLTSPNVPIHYCQWLRKMAEVLEELSPWIWFKIDFDRWPRELVEREYHTAMPITEESVR